MFREAFCDAVSRRIGIGDALADGTLHAASRWGRLEQDKNSGALRFPAWGSVFHWTLPMIREIPVRLPNPTDPGTRSSSSPLVSISNDPESTIAIRKPKDRVTGPHSTEVSGSEPKPMTTMQPGDSRGAARSTQESPQVCLSMASVQPTPDQDPVSRSTLDARGRDCTSR